VSTHAALLNAAHKAAAAADTTSSSSCNGVSKNQQQQQQQQQCNGVSPSDLQKRATCDKAGTPSCHSNGTCKAKTAAATAAAGQQQSGCVTRVTSAQVLGALDGNLCRCTGWRPIADCAKVRADLGNGRWGVEEVEGERGDGGGGGVEPVCKYLRGWGYVTCSCLCV
jgi:hypothetical protein